MAEFKIYAKDGFTVRAEGAPKYVGPYLKPGYLEFQEIGSPTPIGWEVGDYVDYVRTGLRYKLYKTPEAMKQGERNRYGASFLYEHVMFYDACKELEIAKFIDLVPDDNLVHFSTQNTVAFTGTPLDVAERITECMGHWFPASKWEVRIVSGLDAAEDAELIETLATEADFNVSGASCLDALDKVYEIWNGLGWTHSYEDGKNIIKIGASNKRTASNTTEVYNCIGGRCLVSLKRSVSNADEIGTRLYAYGSMRNMSGDYYRSKDIKDAESVYIAHLMIPISSWGMTDGKPDARKAYIEASADAVSKLGLIPKYAYFDGTDGKIPEIFPSIEGMTIRDVGEIKTSLHESKYLPNGSWNGDERIDEIRTGDGTQDDGVVSQGGKAYIETASIAIDARTETASIPAGSDDNAVFSLGSMQADVEIEGNKRFTASLRLSGTIPDNGYGKVVLRFEKYGNPRYGNDPAAEREVELEKDGDGNWPLPAFTTLSFRQSKTDLTFFCYIYVQPVAQDADRTATLRVEGGSIDVGVQRDLEKEFTLHLKQIGFDIEEYAALGEGKTISMKSGLCAGRDFKIKSCMYEAASDEWAVTCYRSKDDDLGILFPNTDMHIMPGDRFVLLDIAMPELYVLAASRKLLRYGQRLLADIDHEKPFYEPEIDAKKVLREGRVLREGLYMHLKDDENVDGGEDYAIIDTLQIDEGASNIPTYNVTLRKQKSVEWTENINKGGDTVKSSTSVEETPAGNYLTKADKIWEIRELEDGRKYAYLKEEFAGAATSGFLSVLGVNPDGGSGSFDAVALWAMLRNTDSDHTYDDYRIVPSHIPIGEGLEVRDGVIVATGTGKGSVTGVALTMPTGFSVSGSPVTESGTLAVSFSDGYSLPTTAKQTAWDGAVTKVAEIAKDYLTASAISDMLTKTEAGKTYAPLSGYSSHVGDAAIHITDSERSKWNKAATDLSSILGADSDRIINKWEEVVAFLDTYTEADTLANLLSNKADKAVKLTAGTGLAGGGTLAGDLTLSLATVGTKGTYTKVTTDEYGRVISGAALSATDVPALAISKIAGLQDALDAKLDKAYFARLFKAHNGTADVAPNDLTSAITDVEAMFGFWTEKYISSLGKNGSASGGGMDLADVWASLASATGTYGSAQIAPSHLADALSGYAKTGQIPDALKSPHALTLTVNGTTTTYDGSAAESVTITATTAWNDITGRPTKLSDFKDDVVSGKYLPLTGGTLTGALTVTSILGGDGNGLLAWRPTTGWNGVTPEQWAVGAIDCQGVIRSGAANLLHYRIDTATTHTILDTYNYASILGTAYAPYHGAGYVKKDGDTMTGALKLPYLLPADKTGARSFGTYLLPYVHSDSIDPTHTTDTYLKALLVWICDNYPHVSTGTFIGEVAPNSVGWCHINIYYTSTRDADTGLPQYSSGVYYTLGGGVIPFGTYNYTWYYGGNFSGVAQSALVANRLSGTRTLWGNTDNGGTNSITGTATMTGNGTAWKIEGSSYTFGLHLGTGGTNRGIYDWTSGIDRWLLYFDNANTILQYGNVGIGNSAPGYKLTVAGAVYASSNIFGYALYTNPSLNDSQSYVISDSATNISLHNSAGFALVADGNVIRRGVSMTTGQLGNAAYPWNHVYSNRYYFGNSGVYLEYDSANKGLHVAGAGIYADTFVASLGANTSGSSGGGLIEAVYGTGGFGGTYSNADLTNTFNAYAINSLYNRIVSLEGGSATSVVQSGSGNYVKSVTKNGTTITVTNANLPTSLPASDVYAWAKAATKPAYTFSELTDCPTKLSDFTDDVVSGKYLPLTGGTMGNTNKVTNLNADLIDGYHASDTVTASTVPVRNADAMLPVTGITWTRANAQVLSSAGWYRIYTSEIGNGNGVVADFYVTRAYSYQNNEAYHFSVSIAYNGGINISQLSGHANYRCITKIRVDYTNSGALYIDIYYNQTQRNTVYVSGTGVGTFQKPTAVSSATGTTVEFETVNGAKNSYGYTGTFYGTATRANYADVLRDPDYNTMGTRRASANVTPWNDAGLHYFLATSSMTTGNPGTDGAILHYAWDNGGWAGQLYLPISDDAARSVKWRGQTSAGTWGSSWHTLLDERGGTITGYLYLNHTGSNYNEGLRLGNTNGVSNTWSEINFGCNTAVTSGTHAHQWTVGRNGNNNYFLIRNNLTDRLTIDLSGNVGIGTASPSYPLDVAGAIHTSAHIAAGNSLVVTQTDGASGYGLSLYGGTSYVLSYGILFAKTSYLGTAGSVTGDWATYFTMDGVKGNTRGWVFRNRNTADNVASISSDGVLWTKTGIYSDGYVSALGMNTSSDLRLKDIRGKSGLSVEQIASLEVYDYYWKNRGNDRRLKVGLLAQDVEAVLPALVGVDRANYKTLDYATLGAVSAVALAKRVLDHERRIRDIEKKLKTD